MQYDEKKSSVLQRALIQLQQYNLWIEHVAGKDNLLADFSAEILY